MAEDFDHVSRLWKRINRELAPPAMAEEFEQYIQSIITDELVDIDKRFTPEFGSAFWVLIRCNKVVGCFGIERKDPEKCELRRMYLDKALRGGSLASWMLKSAEVAAHDFGYRTMMLSTAEIQYSAVRFYEKQGYRRVHVEIANDASIKTVGGGLKRFHYQKKL